ncbi:MAG TPA: tetratricopeptide repeat protein, partial [Terriglobales bacterium]|nr:tetratricopeptide repeat protein [Terriglobales bacterium]
FWLLRTRTYFLGDGYAQISFLKSGQYLKTGFEDLEVWVHLYFYKFLKFFFAPSAESIYAGVSIFAGGILVYILFFLGKSLSEDRLDRLLIFSIFLFSGATQLFLGYAENYTLLYTSIFAYLYFSLRYLQGKVKVIVPGVFCALSIGFHFSSAYLLPSFLFLVSLSKRKEGFAFKMKKAVPYLFILIFLFALSVFYIWSMNPALTEIFVPLLHGRVIAPNYTLFSIPHILDLVNQHLLLSAVGILLLISLASVFKGCMRLRNPMISFLLLVSVGQLFYDFIIDPKLGAGRDWDLLSNVALGYSLLAIYLFIRSVKSGRYASLSLAFTAFLCTTPWLLVNASSTGAISRYRNLLDVDVKKSLTGRWTLVNYENGRNETKMAEQLKTEIFRLFPEDSLGREADFYRSQGDLDKAFALAEQSLKLNPDYIEARQVLGVIYLNQGKLDQAMDEFEKIARVNPYSNIVHQNLGYALVSKGRFQEGLDEFKKAVKLGGANAEVWNNIGYTYMNLGQLEKAIDAFEKSLKMDPKYVDAHFNLGRLYLQSNHFDQALTEFQEVERLKPDYIPVHDYLGYVYKSMGMKDQAIQELELFLKSSKDEKENQRVRGWVQQLNSQKP